MYVEVKPPHNSSVDDCFLCGNSFPRPSECRDCAVPPGLSRTLLSPLLGGPFLISPRRRQSATPDTPSRESRCINTITPPGLGPHRCLRDSYEARSPLGSGLTPYAQPVYPQVGFPVFLLTEYPYDPLIRRWTPSLDSRPPPDLCLSRPHTAVDLQTTPFPAHPPVSLTSVRMV